MSIVNCKGNHLILKGDKKSLMDSIWRKGESYRFTGRKKKCLRLGISIHQSVSFIKKSQRKPVTSVTGGSCF